MSLPDQAVDTGGASAGGRRRQAMLGRAAQAPSGQGLALADVERLRGDSSPAARQDLALKFGRQFDELASGAHASLTGAVLDLLVRDVEMTVRQTLAETVASSPYLPPAIAGVLARDAIDVARPVLEQSPVLDDDELSEIVRTNAMQYAVAVAGRSELSEQLSDALVDTGHAQVVVRLVGNRGADLSKATLGRIADDHRGNRDVQDRLVRRPALPYELADQLVSVIGDRLEWELVQTRRIDADLARQIMHAARERATITMVARDHGDRDEERDLRQRFRAGDLDHEALLASLRDGEVTAFEIGMSLHAAIDLVVVRRMLYGTDRRHMAAVCLRAGFATPHYMTLRMTLDLAEKSVANVGRDEPYGDDTLQFVQRQYDAMRQDDGRVETILREAGWDGAG